MARRTRRAIYGSDARIATCTDARDGCTGVRARCTRAFGGAHRARWPYSRFFNSVYFGLARICQLLRVSREKLKTRPFATVRVRALANLDPSFACQRITVT